MSEAELEELLIGEIAKHLSSHRVTGTDLALDDLNGIADVDIPRKKLLSEFDTVVFWMQDCGFAEFEHAPSDDDDATVFIGCRLTGKGRKEFASHIAMATKGDTVNMSASELNALKNKVMLYIYEHGAGNFHFEVPMDAVKAALGIDNNTFNQICTMLVSQGYWAKGTTFHGIGLNLEGQMEAERLGPLTSLRQPAAKAQNIIDARYSIVQIAGDHSTQSAHQTIDQSALTQILNDIDQELERVPIDPGQKKEAQGLVSALRGYAGKAFDAAGRAISGVLASILTAAGSELGQSLLKLIGTAV